MKKEEFKILIEGCENATIKKDKLIIKSGKINISIPLLSIIGVSKHIFAPDDFSIETIKGLNINKYDRYNNERWELDL